MNLIEGEVIDKPLLKELQIMKKDAERYISMRMDDSCGTLYEGYEKYIRIKERLKKEMVELPIFCRICGEKLNLSSSAEPVWGCSYLGDDGKKENRNIADKHYSDSRSYLSFNDFEAYERVFNILQKIVEDKK